jgi:hypothetical protein
VPYTNLSEEISIALKIELDMLCDDDFSINIPTSFKFLTVYMNLWKLNYHEEYNILDKEELECANTEKSNLFFYAQCILEITFIDGFAWNKNRLPS